MKRSSPFFGLTHFVQCRFAGASFYECIAAFNLDQAAFGYMDDCIKTNRVHAYRVMERNSKGKLTEVLNFKPVKTSEMAEDYHIYTAYFCHVNRNGQGPAPTYREWKKDGKPVAP